MLNAKSFDDFRFLELTSSSSEFLVCPFLPSINNMDFHFYSSCSVSSDCCFP